MESNYSKLLALGIDLKKTSGQVKTLCPKCSPTRKNKTEQCLSVDIDKGAYTCWNCNWKGYVVAVKSEKVYVKPQWANSTGASDNVVKWFTARKISQRVLNEMFIADGKEWMPQVGREANVIKFPYIFKGEVVNVKYRGQVGSKDGAPPKKIFKMVKDAQLVFYNIDALKGSTEALVVEGEPDCLSFLETGYPYVVSVPNGGSKGNQKMEYLDNCYEQFEGKTKIYIGVDKDETGYGLRNELIRRLGDERCFVVDYKDCKDANEYLMKYGPIELLELLKLAKPAPIKGIFRAEELMADVAELYDKGLPPGIKLGLGPFDELLSFVTGKFLTVTGTPGSGKSEFLDQVFVLLAVKHGWKFAVFSPENFPISLHLAKLIEKLVGKPFGKPGDEETKRMTSEEYQKAMAFIEDHFFFIRPDDENYSLDNILGMFRKLVFQYGIKGCILDPWNAIEHQVPAGIQETTYINQQLAKIYSFKQRYDLLFSLVAHPTKMGKDKGGKYIVPTLYNISGSAHFFNRTDDGITVDRDFKEKRTYVYVQKVKFRHLGKLGEAKFIYDYSCGRFNPEGVQFDRRNYLEEKPEEPMGLIPIPDDEVPF